MKSNNFGQESSDSLLDPERTQEVVDEIVLPSREFWAGFCFATVLYLGCLVVFIIEFTVEPWKPSDRSCARQLSSYSPMIDAVEYEEITFANDFEQPSIYRGYPTYEREQAWKNLWDHETMNVPREKFDHLNYSLDVDYMQTPAEYGGGVEALVEVFHQLHCLSLIRQFVYLDYYSVRPHPFNVSDSVIHTHVDHCIETVRMALMCTGDVTPVPIKADPLGFVGAKADFSTVHKCRKWDTLVDWIAEHGIKA